MKRPNVVFVLTDDQGYPALGCNGHPFLQTPNIDRFAADAVSFEQFHCGTTCAPTRAGLMTGHYCNSTGVWHTIGGRSLLRKDEWTLATALRDSGYKTGMFGKWHLGDDHPYLPQDRGFEKAIYHGGGGVGQLPDAWGNDYFDDSYWDNGQLRPFKGYCTDVFFNEALDYIEENKDQPFFCYISTNAPHGPFNVETKYSDLYKGKAESDEYACFLGMITNIDENFGRLEAKLQELDLLDDTLLIFMSDNGQTPVGNTPNMYNAAMRGFKSSQYEGGHRIPFIARWGNGKLVGGRKINELASYVDFMPTLLDICGCEVPAGKRPFHGESLMPLLNHEKPQAYWDSRVITTDTQRLAYPLKYQRSCVMKNKWRLIDCQELYDMAADFSQTTDVAAEHPELVAELKAEYEKWWDLCAEQFDTDTPLSVGDFTTRLTAMDERGEVENSGVWMQEQVRRGAKHLGYLALYAEASGEYEFELCRWPVEELAGVPLKSAIPPEKEVPFAADFIAPGVHAHYKGSADLDITLAQFNIKGLTTQAGAVGAEDVSVKFNATLTAGEEYQLRGFFYNEKMSYCTAPYYIYVRKIG